MIEQVAPADGTTSVTTAAPSQQGATPQVGALFDLLFAALAKGAAPPGNQAGARTATAEGEVPGGDSSDNGKAKADAGKHGLVAALLTALGAAGLTQQTPQAGGPAAAAQSGSTTANPKLVALDAELGLASSAWAPDLTLRGALESMLGKARATANAATAQGTNDTQATIAQDLVTFVESLGQSSAAGGVAPTGPGAQDLLTLVQSLGQSGSAGGAQSSPGAGLLTLLESLGSQTRGNQQAAATAADPAVSASPAASTDPANPVHVGIGSATTGANSSSSLAPATSPLGAGAGAGPGGPVTAASSNETAAAGTETQTPLNADAKTNTVGDAQPAATQVPTDAAAPAGTSAPPQSPDLHAVVEVTHSAQSGQEAASTPPLATPEAPSRAIGPQSAHEATASTVHPEPGVAQSAAPADASTQQNAQQSGQQTAPQQAAASYASQSQSASSSEAVPTNPAATQWQAPLHELAQTAQAVIKIAVRSQASSARITLSPPQLGSIEIRLRYTSKGVSATMTAKSPTALGALTDAGSDLRTALKQQGIDLLSLDIRESTPEAPGSGSRRDDGGEHEQTTQTQVADAAGAEEAVQGSSRPVLGVAVDLFA